jgi:hypothetical protein
MSLPALVAIGQSLGLYAIPDYLVREWILTGFMFRHTAKINDKDASRPLGKISRVAIWSDNTCVVPLSEYPRRLARLENEASSMKLEAS